MDFIRKIWWFDSYLRIFNYALFHYSKCWLFIRQVVHLNPWYEFGVLQSSQTPKHSFYLSNLDDQKFLRSPLNISTFSRNLWVQITWNILFPESLWITTHWLGGWEPLLRLSWTSLLKIFFNFPTNQAGLGESSCIGWKLSFSWMILLL